MKIHGVLTRIRQNLNLVPTSRFSKEDVYGAEGFRADAPEANLTGLLETVEELRYAASKVGTIPAGYPRHIDLVMRVIHKLLPWYTRPIRAFCLRASETAHETALHLSMVARAQDKILASLERLDQEVASLKALQTDPSQRQ